MGVSIKRLYRISFIVSLVFFCNCSLSHHAPKKGSIDVIKGKYKLNTVTSTNAAGQALLTGHVWDKHTGQPVTLSFVYVKERDISMFTGKQGYFKLTLPEGAYTLVATAVNHDSLETKVLNLKKDTQTDVNVYLGERVIH